MKLSHTFLLSMATVGAAHAYEPDQAVLKTAEDRGRQMYLHDHAAAIVSDAVLSQATETARKQLQGYVTEEKGGAIVVTFYGSGDDERQYAWYRAAVGPDGRMLGNVSTYEPPQPLSEYEAGAIAARKTAMNFSFTPCTPNYNSVVLPKPGGWQVYLLPGVKESGVVPLGGTYRIDTDATGLHVTANRAFTKTCLTLQKPADSLGLSVSHLLDPQPTEAHVFWQLWSRQPIYMVTTQNSLIWQIAKGRISYLEKVKEKKR